jgi:hypothetical protein
MFNDPEKAACHQWLLYDVSWLAQWHFIFYVSSEHWHRGEGTHVCANTRLRGV